VQWSPAFHPATVVEGFGEDMLPPLQSHLVPSELQEINHFIPALRVLSLHRM
jgi:hypothetical protein